jgi:hypothetical protein
MEHNRGTTDSSSGYGKTFDAVNRLNRNALLILCLLVIGAGMFSGWGTALSVAIGGILAYLNFSWLKAGVDRILGLETDRRAALILGGFVGRLLLILGGLFAMIHFSFMSLYGALLGLSIFVLAGIVEAVFLVVRRTS